MTKDKPSFTELVSRVETSLTAVEHAKTDVARAEAELDSERGELRKREVELTNARDALYAAYPELLPAAPVAQTPIESEAFEPVEVDDPDDVPGFGAIEFRERD